MLPKMNKYSDKAYSSNIGKKQLPYFGVYKSTPCVSRPAIWQPKKCKF